MAHAKGRRGRPKGTGIDDTARLERLAEVLHAHPGMRPTTAIRKMGISNPSVIRRLRDKYKAFQKKPAKDTADQIPEQTPDRRRNYVSLRPLDCEGHETLPAIAPR